jgi:hypothetical protein
MGEQMIADAHPTLLFLIFGGIIRLYAASAAAGQTLQSLR